MLFIIQIALGIVLAVVLLTFYQPILRFVKNFMIGSVALAIIAGIGFFIYAQYQDYQHKAEVAESLSKLSDAQLDALIAQYKAPVAKLSTPDLSKLSDAQLEAIVNQDPSGLGAQPWAALKIDKVDVTKTPKGNEIPTNIRASQPLMVPEKQVYPIQ